MVSHDPHEQTAPTSSDQQAEQRVRSPFGGLVAESLLEPVVPSSRTQESARTGTYVLERYRHDKSNEANHNSRTAAEAGGAASAARPRRRDAMGLSTSPIRPQRSDMWQANVYAGGSLIEVHGPGMRGQKGGGKRGIIKRFSEGSRRRLLRSLNRVKRDLLPVFVTLTYPDNFPGNPRVWKAHLNAWLKRLKRQHPQAAGFWKLELTPRQSGTNAGEIAPHFHLLLWGLPESWEQLDGRVWTWRFVYQQQQLAAPGLVFWKQEKWRNGAWYFTCESSTGQKCDGAAVEFVSERVNKKGEQIRSVEFWKKDATGLFEQDVRDAVGMGNPVGTVNLLQWVSLTWAEVVASGDPRHVRAGTRVEAIRSREGVMFYASKYVCKLDTGAAESSGRFWGIHNAPAIPWAEAVSIPVDRQQAVRLMRVARRYIWTAQRQREHPHKIHWRANCGMTFFCDASWWLQRLPSLAGG